MNDVVEVAVQPQGGYVVARLSGQLSLQTVVAARQALVAHLRSIEEELDRYAGDPEPPSLTEQIEQP